MSNATSTPFNPAQTDWNLIRGFVAVVEQGSLTRAAEQLGLSQPTLSRQITQLELAVGAALFERVARGLKLTAAGDGLVEPARHMMAAARALGMATAAQGDTLSGTVRITASEMVSAFVLPPLMAQLALAYPDIQIEIVASNQISNLLEREADIAIRMIRPTQSALIARHIGDWSLSFYAHASYFTNNAKLLPRSAPSPQELAQYRWIGYDQSDQLIAGFRSAGIHIDTSFFAFRSDNHLVNWQALLNGVGIGICMDWLAKQTPDLVRLPLAQSPPTLPVWLTTHRELRSSKKIRAVFDFLAQALTEVDGFHG
jgi:DNA-binding transcriptional LysR family regulator